MLCVFYNKKDYCCKEWYKSKSVKPFFPDPLLLLLPLLTSNNIPTGPSAPPTHIFLGTYLRALIPAGLGLKWTKLGSARESAVYCIEFPWPFIGMHHGPRKGSAGG